MESGSGSATIQSSNGAVITAVAEARYFAAADTGLTYSFTQYRAEFTALQAGARYSYVLNFNGQQVSGPLRTFTTAAAGKCSFVVYGDTGENTAEQKTLIREIAAEPGIGFLLHMGDLAYPSGTYSTYETNYLDLNEPLLDHLPIFPTPGNHDYLADGGAAYLALHALPGNAPESGGRYYSFDWGDIHFASVDTNLMFNEASARMLQWLDSDLAATNKFWKVVFLHHAPYPTGHHLTDSVCAETRKKINPIVERYGVQIVFGGHEHGYERTVELVNDEPVSAGTGTTYVITGGGGASLHDVGTLPQTAKSLSIYNYLRVDVDSGVMTVRSIGLGSAEIDRFTIQPKPSISTNGIVTVGDYTAAMAPGALVSIFGRNLALQATPAAQFPLPNQLGGTQVKIGGVPAPFTYVSPGQVNVQVPFEVQGNVPVELTTLNGVARASAVLANTAPAILAVTYGNSIISPSNAPPLGGQVVIYATGLGACRSTLATGAPAIGAVSTVAQVLVYLGDIALQPGYAGAAPGFAGLDQVNFAVPPALTPGKYSLRLVTTDGSSRGVPLVVQAPQ